MKRCRSSHHQVNFDHRLAALSVRTQFCTNLCGMAYVSVQITIPLGDPAPVSTPCRFTA